MNSSKPQKSVAIFGGTFDPVHNGHIKIACELKKLLDVDELRLVPSLLPPHRNQPRASEQQRLTMLQLATRDTDLVIDERELQRKGTSYTVDTLRSLRGELGPDVTLVLCMGTDAFCALDSWHHWQEILTLAHIAVAKRADCDLNLNKAMSKLLTEHKVKSPEHLLQQPGGKIYLAELSQVPLSSTQVREALMAGNLSADALPLSVQQYIEEQQLYRD